VYFTTSLTGTPHTSLGAVCLHLDLALQASELHYAAGLYTTMSLTCKPRRRLPLAWKVDIKVDNEVSSMLPTPFFTTTVIDFFDTIFFDTCF
jgi:hypothetical protein